MLARRLTIAPGFPFKIILGIPLLSTVLYFVTIEFVLMNEHASWKGDLEQKSGQNNLDASNPVLLYIDDTPALIKQSAVHKYFFSTALVYIFEFKEHSNLTNCSIRLLLQQYKLKRSVIILKHS